MVSGNSEGNGEETQQDKSKDHEESEEPHAPSAANGEPPAAATEAGVDAIAAHLRFLRVRELDGKISGNSGPGSAAAAAADSKKPSPLSYCSSRSSDELAISSACSFSSSVRILDLCWSSGSAAAAAAADSEKASPLSYSSSRSSDESSSFKKVFPTVPLRDGINSLSDDGVMEEAPANLLAVYSDFRPIRHDENNFYMSFIFSYVEQILDRDDTDEECRVLTAIGRIASQQAHLGRASSFSTSCEAFRNLMNMITKWKNQLTTSNRRHGEQKLLQFFNSDHNTEPIMVFLRLVARIWICSHREEYEPFITKLGEGGYSAKDWCVEPVIPCHEWADHIQMMAMATALEVPLRIEHLNGGPAQDIYTGQGDCHVILLYLGNHCGIIYPHHPSDETSYLPHLASDSQCQSQKEANTALMPSAAGDQCELLPETAGAVTPLIHNVWHGNIEQELRELHSLVGQGKVTIAIDMEFASTAKDQERPTTATQWYDNLYELVDGGDVLQLGLAVSVDSADPPLAARVCQLNLKFDMKKRPYNANTIKFLTDQGYDLQAHNTHGILSSRIAEWFLNELDRFYDRGVTWVVFQGDADVGFLLNLLGNSMPGTRVGYLQRYTCSLPQLYDVRVLARIMFGQQTRGLNWVADAINVKRIGQNHCSGSDALLTLNCFFELRKRLGVGAIKISMGVLSGLFNIDDTVSQALPMGHVSLRPIQVWEHNFHQESAVIAQFVQNNFCIVGLDVQFFPDLCDEALKEKKLCHRRFHSRQDCYQLMVQALGAVSYYQISLAFVSYMGQIALGRWWNFHLSEYTNRDLVAEGGPQHIHCVRFTEMLHTCNLINNPEIIWATFEGAHSIGSLYHMVRRDTPQDFPVSIWDYMRQREDLFLFLYDLRLLVSREIGDILAEVARGMGLSVPAEQSQWNALLSAQILVRVRDSFEDSDSVLESYAEHRGHLLAKCCSRSNAYR